MSKTEKVYLVSALHFFNAIKGAADEVYEHIDDIEGILQELDSKDPYSDLAIVLSFFRGLKGSVDDVHKTINIGEIIRELEIEKFSPVGDFISDRRYIHKNGSFILN